MPNFMQHNFIWMFLVPFLWIAIGFGYLYYRHKRSGVVFPYVPQEQIRFEERAASGCSYKTILTRLGGARHCLHVTVTDAEVWIRPFFPFIILAQSFDLEHRIPRTFITSIRPTQSVLIQSLLLEYRDARGNNHRLSLALRNPDGFLRALGLTKGSPADVPLPRGCGDEVSRAQQSSRTRSG